MMRAGTKKILLSLFVTILAIAVSVSAPLSVMASSVKVSASRDDIYNQLLEASRINVVANTLKKCISHIKSSAMGVNAVKNGSDIFDGGLTTATNTEISTALWVEDKIQGNGGDDGAIWCKQDGGGQNILQLFASLTGLNIAEDMMCNGGYHRLVHRAKLVVVAGYGYGSSYYTYDEDRNCNSFNDASAYYLRSSDAVEQFKDIYTAWYNSRKSENPYLPTYAELGNFNNVDGYFNYITDFNLKCDADKVTKKNKVSGTDYFKITEYDKTENKVVAQNYYYHVNRNKSWTYSLSDDNAANSCTGLLDRISALQTTSNGIPVANRSGGYENIILANLNDACKDAKTSEGNNGWQELKVKLQEIVDDPDSPEDAVNGAKKNIEEINRIVSSGNYVESSGSEDDEDGKIYQCVNIDGLVINVNNYDTPSTDPDFTGNGGGEVEMTCGNSGGAASLGWIVCPVLEWMGEASEKIYTDYVEPSLQIEPKLFSTNSDEGTRKAWGIFQNIANIAFVILLLAVIFSQLTGVGIDNYGIKKILPKLIVAAVLVNLSYYICLVCVDVSNIVGNGVQALFNGLDVGTPYLNIPDSNAALKAGSTTAITGVAVLSALAVMVGAIWTNPAILLSLLVAALGIVIAIFFLFLLLAAREAAIVVLVVVSPIAFVCYMLPNTKKIFDRWLKIGQGLLLVYPIVGLLVGGGNFVSRLLLSSGFASNGFFAAFSAMVIGVAPIFFIPSVLKGSFSAMGNLGAKISGIGDRLRGGVDKRLRNTDAYKNAQERGMERRTRIRAGLDKNGKPIEDMKGFGRFIRGGKRNMARSRAQYLKNQDARNREESLNGIGFQAAVLGQQKRAEKDELADYMTYINNETRNGEDSEALYRMYDDYMAKGDKSGAVAVARIAGRRKDTAADFLRRNITSDEAVAKNVKYEEDRPDLLASVMKEISTGENSGMYRSSTPLGFEFAAQYNKSYKKQYGPNDTRPEVRYSAWRSGSVTKTREDGSTYEERNVDRALSNYVTNSQELVGTKNSSLTELNELMASGTMGKDEITRIRQLANETIENRGRTGVWDTTKAENIYKLAGREAEYKAMVGDAAGAVRGENAVAGAESSGLDVRAAAAQQTVGSQPQAAPVQPVEVSVRQQAAGSAVDLRALGDETLLDIATNPNAENSDATRTAAEQEYLRRNPGFNSGAEGNAGTNNAQPPHVPPQE